MASQQQTVRAWTYTGGYPSTLKLSKVQVPASKDLSPHQALVKIHACALNPVDIQVMNLPNHKGSTQEKTTVMDFCGAVLAKGSEVKFDAGETVFGMIHKPFLPAGGGLSEQAVVDLSGSPVVSKPEKWSVEQAAGVSLVWLTAKRCIEAVEEWVDAQGSNKRVAILGGSSAVGMYAAKLAKRKGWKVCATSSARNRDFVLNDLKADAHVDYTGEDVRQGVSKFEPVAVIDCVGGTECVGLPSSKRYITIVGDKTGRTEMGGPYTYYDWSHPVQVVSQWWRWALGQVGLGEAYDVVILRHRNDWLEDAKATLSADEIYVDGVYAFEDADKAFERLNTGRAKGKVVVRVDGATKSKL